MRISRYKNKGIRGSDDVKTVPEVEKCKGTYDDDYLKTMYHWAYHPFTPNPQLLPVMKLCLIVAGSHGYFGVIFKQSTVASLLCY